MTFDTYANLQSEIAGYMKRADLTDRITGFIALAETDIGRRLRVQQMDSLESLSVSSGDPTVSLPALCRDVFWVKLNGTNERNLRSMPGAAFWHKYVQETSGVPLDYYHSGGTLELGPTPNDDYTLTALCVLAPSPLSASNTTNTILTNHPDVYFYGSLMHGFRYVRNRERMEEATEAFIAAIDSANMEARNLRSSGTPSGIRSLRRMRVP